MDEYSRITIENYCRTYNSAKSRRLNKLVRLSYNIRTVGTDEDAIWLESAIEKENDPELRSAMEELDEFLFC